MATLDDLPIPNFLKLTEEDQLQLILEVRTRRAVVIPTKRSPSTRKSAAIPTADTVAQMSEKQITDLYFSLMAKQQGELLK